MFKKILIITYIIIQFFYSYKVFPSDDISNNSGCYDDDGKFLNVHAGNIIYKNGYYYWVGEYRVEGNVFTQKFSLYRSRDLHHWKNLGIVYDLSSTSKIINIERPKIIYNHKNNNYLIWYHEEFGKIFNNAKVAVAFSKNITGPFKYIKSFRPNAGLAPIYDDSDKYSDPMKEIANEQFRKDFNSGQMSRDMNVFKDFDGKAYIVYSAENNKTIQISELDSNYINFTGKYSRILVGRVREAPTIFRRKNKYYLLTSGVTGYKPNRLHLSTSNNIFFGWEEKPNPIVSTEASEVETSFNSQISSVLHIHDTDNYLYISDRWNDWKLFQSRYVWLRINWKSNFPIIDWDLYEFKESK